MDKTVYVLLSLLARLFRLLPAQISASLGSALGTLCLWLMPRRKELCRSNLRHAGFDEDLCEQVFSHLGRLLVDILPMWCSDRLQVVNRVEVEGVENYRSARERAGRVILVTAHFGNWEKMAWVHRQTSGVPLQVVGRPLDQQGADRFLRELRERGDLQVLNKERGVRAMIKALRGGFELGILVDQKVPPALGIELPFFSRRVPVLPVVSLLAKSTGAAIVPVFIFLDRDGREKVNYLPEIRQSGDAVTETAELTRVMEDFIRRFPEQWFWVHNRWRYARPAVEEAVSGEPSVLKKSSEAGASEREKGPDAPEQPHPDQHRTAK